MTAIWLKEEGEWRALAPGGFQQEKVLRDRRPRPRLKDRAVEFFRDTAAADARAGMGR